MNNKDLQLLKMQIKDIILNNASNKNHIYQNDDINEIQEMLNFLTTSIHEADDFLTELAKGNLDAQVPSRNNYLASSVKQLHASLRHLTWQAEQVSKGDYNQNISFLGDFSNAFNSMVQQLQEREEKLKLQSYNLTATNDLMISIMDSLKDWIIVINSQTGQIIYLNHAAEKLFNDRIGESLIDEITDLMDNLKDKDLNNFDYVCKSCDYIINVKTFDARWSDTLAKVFHISDVTADKQQIEQFEMMAFKDELTGLHNRRYCINELKRLIDNKQSFSFCMIDIDYLKLANDQYGHLAGDEYLNKVTDELSEVIRATDSICRIGEDEFAVIFPHCTSSLVSKKMDIVNDKLLRSSSDYPMSISYGIIEIIDFDGITVKSVLKDADELMYLNKEKRK